VRNVAQLKGFYDAIQALVAQRKLLAYHDRPTVACW
jgi:phosphoribosylformylglycinamidine synthase